MKLKYIICRGDYIFFASLHLQVALSVCLSVCLPTGLLKKLQIIKLESVLGPETRNDYVWYDVG